MSDYPHRLVFTREGVVVLDAKADVQDAGASVPRNMTGQPGTEATATAYLADERAGVLVEQYDAVTDYCPNGQIKVGEVDAAARELDGAMLLRLDEAGLTHTVILETAGRVRTEGGVYTTSWVAEAAQPGRLTPVGGGTGTQADQPSAAGQYVLTLRSTAVVSEGMRALVKGHVDDDPTKAVLWQRLVSITKVLLPTRSKDRRQSVLAVDVEMNP